VTAGPGLASLGDFLGQELQYLAGSSPEGLPEPEETAPPQIQASPSQHLRRHRSCSPWWTSPRFRQVEVGGALFLDLRRRSRS
jgi:hypothetical protein